ncbi:hypothetical protein [Phytobacter sp. AG2a]
MTTQLPSKERLAHIANFHRAMTLPPSHDEIEAMATALLAAHDQEPVAYIAYYDSGAIHGVCQWDDTVKMEWLKRGFSVQPIYTHPAPSIPAAVPEEGKTEIKWRDLALQFDGHRMQAICFLRTALNCLPEEDFSEAREFLKAGPLPGEEVLRVRISAMLNHQSSNQVITAAAVGGEIKQPASNGCWCHTCRQVTMGDMRFVVCPDCGNKRCPKANNHRNACSGSNEPGQEGSAYPAAPKQDVTLKISGLICTSDERKMEVPTCRKHPGVALRKHPFMQLSCYPPRPALYCRKCEPHVAEWEERDKKLRSYGKGV